MIIGVKSSLKSDKKAISFRLFENYKQETDIERLWWEYFPILSEKQESRHEKQIAYTSLVQSHETLINIILFINILICFRTSVSKLRNLRKNFV